MLFTDEGTTVPSNSYPLAFANGVEWSTRRHGRKDQFDCLYRHGILNKALWYLGAYSAIIWSPRWVKPNNERKRLGGKARPLLG